MNPLQARKQLLIAESELNRVRFVQECQGVAAGINHLFQQAQSLQSLAASATSLIGGLASFSKISPPTSNVKSSWLHKITTGIRLFSTIWLLVRSHRSAPEEATKQS